MKKEAFNYKGAFGQPIIIREVTDKVSLPMGGARLSRIIIFAITLFFMWLFRSFINSIGALMPGLTLVLYLGVPFFLSGILLKIKANGKQLHYFIWDYLIYLFTIKIGKKHFANDQKTRYLRETTQFDYDSKERKSTNVN